MNVLFPRTSGLSHVSVCQWPILSLRRGGKYWSKKFMGWQFSPISVKLTSYYVRDGNESLIGRVGSSNVGVEHDDCVEVILLGSRRDSLIDFCAGSPFLSPTLRFWTIFGDESGQVQLQQKIISQGSLPRTKEHMSVWQSSCKAVILVVSTAYGSDHAAALELLSSARSKIRLLVVIILKPFSFEGKRRQEEVNDLLFKLQKQANFCTVLDTDTLLENDLVTLDEAWKTSNSAALMVMNAISILSSDKHKKILNTRANRSSDLQAPELIKILKSYSDARSAFGSAYNVKESIFQAINGCATDKKDPDGLIFCAIATSASIASVDVNDVFQTVRFIINYKGEIIVSVVSEPNLEPNTTQTTVIYFDYNKQCSAPQNGILLSLGRHFPFIFNIFKNQDQQNSDSEEASLRTPVLNLPDIHYMRSVNSSDSGTDDVNAFSGNIQPLVEDANDKDCSIRDEVNSEENTRELMEFCSNFSTFELNSEGYPTGRQLARGTVGSESYGSSFSEVNALDGSVSAFKQPVGVKISKIFKESSTMKSGALHGNDHNEKRQPGRTIVSLPEPTDYFQNELASINRDIHTSSFKKQGDLSVRAASMLESERDASKKWSRVVEMKYRGGRYKGRIEGGLPEGKGCLFLKDGSMYDGIWRNGKRCGTGTFYFGNGDFFQGSWRDDVMHGKGWIYFESGDRWFANFWKGKANGGGRFYSKRGDVFFGNFKEGWRHGHFLRINVDGTRWQELWDEGVFVSEKPLGVT